MEKSNYLVIKTYHERYYFSTITNFYWNKTLKDILNEYELKMEDLDSSQKGFYMVDKSQIRQLGNVELNYYKIDGVDGFDPDCLIIVDLNEINPDNDYNEFIWGHTNTKFGLLDIRKED